jgi:hypothetical protein
LIIVPNYDVLNHFIVFSFAILLPVQNSVTDIRLLCRQLHSDRDPIPDVPAVYFCLPTEENLGRIGQDFQSNLYDAYHLNFISPISRQRLEDLAAAALQANCVSQIQKVMSSRIMYDVGNVLFTENLSASLTDHDILCHDGGVIIQHCQPTENILIIWPRNGIMNKK